MTGMTERNTSQTEIEDLIALHALGALDEHDRARVERHLASDPQARAQYDQMRETVTALHNNIVSVEPSERPRQRVLARVDAALYSEQPQTKPQAQSSLARVLRVLWPALAVASLVLAVGLGAWGISLRQQLSRAQQEAALFQASDVQVASLPPNEGTPQNARITFVKSASLNRALLTVNGLPVLPSNRTYQFWLLKDGQPVSAGLLAVAADGTGRINVASAEPINVYQQAGITVEPAGGSATPTLTALVSIGPIN